MVLDLVCVSMRRVSVLVHRDVVWSLELEVEGLGLELEGFWIESGYGFAEFSLRLRVSGSSGDS